MSGDHGHAPDVKAYMMVFGALMVLTVVTVGVSYIHLPPVAAVALGLAIATVKAGLVAAFFMHLKGERTIIYGLLGVTVFFMAILFWGPLKDSGDLSPRRIAPAEAPAQAANPSH